jgi:hypothetical protein
LGRGHWVRHWSTGQPWAGAAGCLTSGTDFVADASPPSHTTTASVQNIWALRASWLSDWRDAVRVNNGFIVSTTAAGFNSWNSTEASGNQPSVEIDYEEALAGGGAPLFMHSYRRRR